MGNGTAGLAPFERVAAALREAVSSGRLKPRDRLPSNRVLAEQHEVSLPTLQRAVALLQEEGWLVSRASVGVFVADEPPTEAPIMTLADVRHALSELRSAVATLEKRLDRLEAADQ